MTETLKITSGVLSHPGRKRSNNEDFVLFFEPADPQVLRESGCVYIVADGVGGAAEGERASQYAAEKVLHEYYRYPELDPGVRLKQAMQQASREIFEYAESGERYKRMATTLVAAAVRAGQLTVAHVGDSRAYLLRDGKFRQLTRDHSTVGELVAQGLMTEDEAQTSKAKNRLTRSLGSDEDTIVDVQYDIPLQPGDRLLLCSDGLTRYALGEKIAEMAVIGSPEEAAARLVDFANRSGGADNVSVIVAAITTAVEPLLQGGGGRGRLPERVDWESISTRPGKRKIDQPRKFRLDKRSIIPITLISMVILALSIFAIIGLWKRNGGGAGPALATTGMPAAQAGGAVITPTLEISATVTPSPPVAPIVIAPTLTITPATTPASAPIPPGSWCVYIVGDEPPKTIREIIVLFAGEYSEELSDQTYAAENGRPWGDTWPNGLDETLPSKAQVALSFVKTKEECERHDGFIQNRPIPYP